jgi:hypothetical protein
VKIHISKPDAAKRQLETAINFFFRNGDPVSIHSLTGASFQILEDICIKREIKSFQKQMLEQVRENMREEFGRRLSAAKNFFKHADKDPDGIIDFNPELTTFYLWDACRMYSILTSEDPPLFKIFTLWFNLKNPEALILDSSKRAEFDRTVKDLGLDPNITSTFLPMIPVAEQAHFQF